MALRCFRQAFTDCSVPALLTGRALLQAPANERMLLVRKPPISLCS